MYPQRPSPPRPPFRASFKSSEAQPEAFDHESASGMGRPWFQQQTSSTSAFQQPGSCGNLAAFGPQHSFGYGKQHSGFQTGKSVSSNCSGFNGQQTRPSVSFVYGRQHSGGAQLGYGRSSGLSSGQMSQVEPPRGRE